MTLKKFPYSQCTLLSNNLFLEQAISRISFKNQVVEQTTSNFHFLLPVAAVRSTPGNINPLRNFKLSIKVRSGGRGELIVSWRKAKTNKTIDGYYIYWKVKCRKTQFQREILQNSQANRYIISDLQNSTTYLVEARAFQKTFKGKMSDVVRGSTSPEAVFLKMNINQNDSDSIKVEWKRLWKKNSGDDEVKEYNVSIVATWDVLHFGISVLKR